MSDASGSVTLAPGLAYPGTRRGDQGDDFHGLRVDDPYRWLEELASEPVAGWLDQQDRLTTTALHSHPAHGRADARLRELWNFPRTSLPQRIGRRTFVERIGPEQEVPALYMADSDGSEAFPVVDPNAMASDGSAAITTWVADPRATRLAYGIARGGSDRQTVFIRDLDAGTTFPEALQWTKSEEDLPFPSIAWDSDGSGFYYSRLPDPKTVSAGGEYSNSAVYRHVPGTPQADDLLIFESPDEPDLNYVPIVTDDGQYLLLHVWRGLSGRHQVLIRSLGSSGPFAQVFPEADAKRIFLGSAGDRLFFHTNAAAPNGRVIGVSVQRGVIGAWTEVVPEQAEPIARARLLGGRIVVVTVRDSHHRLSMFDLEGRQGPRLELPEAGTVTDATLDADGNQLLIAFESFLRPPGIIHFDLGTGFATEEPATEPPFDRSSFTTTQAFAPADDGVAVPITIVHRRDATPDGADPLLLYGYGGFNVNTTPLFDPSLLWWLEQGGTYAIANPRGGGEYGESWHDAGRRDRKQQCFDDFATAATWLVENRYTETRRLAIRGESNGGLLMAASMLQRPDLFGAVVCSLPVTDMLRFPRYTIGHYWTDEYGDAAVDERDFETLLRYSPLEHVRADVDYPPVLITTGDGDDRVVPSHAMKFAATLQAAASSQSSPRLLRVQKGVGHGLGKPASKVLELDAEILTFLMATVGAVRTPTQGNGSPA